MFPSLVEIIIQCIGRRITLLLVYTSEICLSVLCKYGQKNKCIIYNDATHKTFDSSLQKSLKVIYKTSWRRFIIIFRFWQTIERKR